MALECRPLANPACVEIGNVLVGFFPLPKIDRVLFTRVVALNCFGTRGAKVGRQAQIIEAQGSMTVHMSMSVITSTLKISISKSQWQ